MPPVCSLLFLLSHGLLFPYRGYIPESQAPSVFSLLGYFGWMSQQPAALTRPASSCLCSHSDRQVLSRHKCPLFFSCLVRREDWTLGLVHDACTLALPLSWFMLFYTSMVSYCTPLFEMTVFSKAKMAFFFKTQLSINYLWSL